MNCHATFTADDSAAAANNAAAATPPADAAAAAAPGEVGKFPYPRSICLWASCVGLYAFDAYGLIIY